MLSTVFYIKAEQTFNSTKFAPLLHRAYFFMRKLKRHSSSFRVKNCKDSKHSAREENITVKTSLSLRIDEVRHPTTTDNTYVKDYNSLTGLQLLADLYQHG
jgi:hypothetical protein